MKDPETGDDLGLSGLMSSRGSLQMRLQEIRRSHDTEAERNAKIHVWALKVEGGMRGAWPSSCGTESRATIDSRSTRTTLLALGEGTGVGVLWLL